MGWMRHSRLYIDWYMSAITLTRNGVSFQLYPAEMHKLLKDTVFLQLIEAEGYPYKGGQVDLSQCLFEDICCNKPKSTTIPPLSF